MTWELDKCEVLVNNWESYVAIYSSVCLVDPSIVGSFQISNTVKLRVSVCVDLFRSESVYEVQSIHCYFEPFYPPELRAIHTYHCILLSSYSSTHCSSRPIMVRATFPSQHSGMQLGGQSGK